MTTLGPGYPPMLQRPAPSRGRRLIAPLSVIGGLGAATLALALRDPHVQGSWGICPSAAMGFDCPGCGGLRGVHDLTQLNFAQSASSNLLVFVMIPIAVFLLGRWAYDAWTGRPRTPNRTMQRAALAAFVVSALVFTVLRNVPAGSWLAA